MNKLDIRWSVPLTVFLQNGLRHTFASVHEAVDFLEHEWPIRRGQNYERALRACRGAVLKTTPVAIARQAFVTACVDARMPVCNLSNPSDKAVIEGSAMEREAFAANSAGSSETGRKGRSEVRQFEDFASEGAYGPADMVYLQSVFNSLRKNHGLAEDDAKSRDLAVQVLSLYRAGIRDRRTLWPMLMKHRPVGDAPGKTSYE